MRSRHANPAIDEALLSMLARYCSRCCRVRAGVWHCFPRRKFDLLGAGFLQKLNTSLPEGIEDYHFDGKRIMIPR